MEGSRGIMERLPDLWSVLAELLLDFYMSLGLSLIETGIGDVYGLEECETGFMAK